MPVLASIVAPAGIFQWAPTADQIGTTNLKVRLCDGGSPDYCVTNTLVVSVTPNPPHSLDIQQVSAGTYRFTILEGTTTVDYILQRTSELCTCPCKTVWEDVMRVSPAQTPYLFEYSPPDSITPPYRFFRLKQVSRIF